VAIPGFRSTNTIMRVSLGLPSKHARRCTVLQRPIHVEARSEQVLEGVEWKGQSSVVYVMLQVAEVCSVLYCGPAVRSRVFWALSPGHALTSQWSTISVREALLMPTLFLLPSLPFHIPPLLTGHTYSRFFAILHTPARRAKRVKCRSSTSLRHSEHLRNAALYNLLASYSYLAKLAPTVRLCPLCPTPITEPSPGEI